MKTLKIIGSNKSFDNEIEMVSALMQYCKTHRKTNAVNLSRDFQAEDNFGTLYLVSIKFDRDENLTNVHIERRKKQAAIVFPFSVTSSQHMQFFASREDMLAFVTLHPSERFKLSANKDGNVKTFYIYYEDGVFYVDGKKYIR